MNSDTNLPDSWDASQIELDAHFLQSAEWAQFQQVYGREVLHGQSNIWSWLGTLQSAKLVRFLSLPYGPTVKTDVAGCLESIEAAAKEAKLDFLRIEPVGTISSVELEAAGYHEVKPVQPKYPWVLDLAPSEEELRAGLERGHRNRINTAPKRGITVEQSTDLSLLDEFLRLLHDTGSGRFANHPDSYFRTMAETLIPAGVARFFVARAEGKSVSISLVYDWNGVRYYAHTGNDQALNRQYKASVYLVWQMILDAKAHGFKQFNFWGVTPNDDPSDPWYGFSQFKKAYGGRLDEQLGTWEKPLNSVKYKIYDTKRKLSS
jgi:lipid II:glycine glycyltransferase (peptidoglycan interpeptide bridge formation enzyme)